MNLEVLVEELSAKEALDHLLPKIVPDVSFEMRVFRGKEALLRELPARLRGYAGWIAAAETRVVVVVDRDDDDCVALKSRLVKMAAEAGLDQTRVLSRIVIEELEAWFFGDVSALRAAYPRVPASLGEQAPYRDPDGINGGTWQALHRVLREHGYHSKRFDKVAAAQAIAPHMDVESNRSTSFQIFRDGLRRLVSEVPNAQAH